MTIYDDGQRRCSKCGIEYYDANRTIIRSLTCKNCRFRPERLNPEDTNESIVTSGESARKCVDAALSCYGNCLSSHVPEQIRKIFGICDSPNSANK